CPTLPSTRSTTSWPTSARRPRPTPSTASPTSSSAPSAGSPRSASIECLCERRTVRRAVRPGQSGPPGRDPGRRPEPSERSERGEQGLGRISGAGPGAPARRAGRRGHGSGSRSGPDLVTAAAEDAAAFAFGGAAPDAVVDPVGEGVLQAGFLDGAVGADLAGLLDADAVGGEEVVGRPAPALGLEHPLMLLV